MPEKKPCIGVESAAVEVEEGPDDDEAEEPPVAVRAAELVSATAVDDVSGARRMRCIALPLFCEKMFLLYFFRTDRFGCACQFVRFPLFVPQPLLRLLRESDMCVCVECLF